jgi:hypothetical protein
MTAKKRVQLARALLAAIREESGGPGGRLRFLDRLEASCSSEGIPIIATARQLVRNGVAS